MVVAAQNSQPAFEVASIKPNNSGDRSAAVIPQPGGGLTATNVTLIQLLRFGFQIQEYQVAGQPAWASSLRFDVVAKADSAGAPHPADAWQPMLQNLLADRFKLRFHREQREVGVYELVVVRGGHKLKQASLDNCSPPPAGMCGMFRASASQIIGDQVTMEAFATRLSRSLGRPVVDKTKLSGVFNLLLQWTPDAPPEDATGPSIFTAMQEQLGLRLESAKGPVEVLVIDGVERPSEN
jgi:uncharacterized protein (TIGR03435 family)